jgi:hypothetical protein
MKLAIALALALLGCARVTVPPTSPTPAAPVPASYGWPPVVNRGPELARWPGPAELPLASGPRPVGTAPAPGPLARPVAVSTAPIPAGDACVAELGALGIRHRRLEERRGVETPVKIEGPLGGIDYVAGAGLPFESDCRLAIALHQVGPVLATLGITKLRYSGVYTYRMSRTGRLSLHAHGLAIDVHEAFADGTWLSVKRDYQAGLTEPCADGAPLLNRATCKLKATSLFRELLTPDHNADHRDHLHLAISR